jgi:glycosyltransferase involved in cell wall biosynthesis
MIDASGIGVYLAGALPYILDTRNDFLLIGDSRKLIEFEKNNNVRIIDCVIKPFSIGETFFPPSFLYNTVNRTDLFYSPYFNIPAHIRVPVYTTIHDIIFPDMPELCSCAGLAARMWFYHRAFRLSKKIFTVSQFSKSRIEYHLGNTKPVIVAHSGIQDRYQRQLNRQTDIKKQKYILFIGNIKKHKGLSCLIDAFLEARNAGLDYKLIIVGKENNFRTSDGGASKKLKMLLEESNGDMRKNILFTGFVSDEELQKLLTEAALLVQPSLYEGFGLPPLEALAYGTPALISDIPAFKEIYAGYPVTYFHAGDSGELKESLLRILSGGIPEAVELPEGLRSKYTLAKTANVILRNLI